jgi:hypothetical protein
MTLTPVAVFAKRFLSAEMKTALQTTREITFLTSVFLTSSFLFSFVPIQEHFQNGMLREK